MNLESVVLETLLTAVLRHPKRFPFKLARAARLLRASDLDGKQTLTMKHVNRHEPICRRWNRDNEIARKRFVKQIIKHADKLPALMVTKDTTRKLG